MNAKILDKKGKVKFTIYDIINYEMIYTHNRLKVILHHDEDRTELFLSDDLSIIFCEEKYVRW